VNSFTISFPLGAVSTVVIGEVVLCGSRFKLPAPVAGHHLGPLGKADKLLAIGMRKSFSVPGRVSAADACFAFFKLAQLLRADVAGASIVSGGEVAAIKTGHFIGHKRSPFLKSYFTPRACARKNLCEEYSELFELLFFFLLFKDLRSEIVRKTPVKYCELSPVLGRLPPVLGLFLIPIASLER
jgi:hypothetical protein